MRELDELRAKRHLRGSGDESSSLQQFCFTLQRNEEKRRHCSVRTREIRFLCSSLEVRNWRRIMHRVDFASTPSLSAQNGGNTKVATNLLWGSTGTARLPETDYALGFTWLQF